jgi:hypothetical protein
MKLTTHLYLVPRSRMLGDIPPLFQYTFMAWCSVKKKAQEQLYLTCTYFLFLESNYFFFMSKE